VSGIRRVATALQSKEYENHRRRMEGKLFLGIEISTQQVFADFLLCLVMTSYSLYVGCCRNICWLGRVMQLALFFPRYAVRQGHG